MKLRGIFRPIRSERGPTTRVPTVLRPPPRAKAVAATAVEKPTSVAKGIQWTDMMVTVKPQVKKLPTSRRKGAFTRHRTQGRS